MSSRRSRLVRDAEGKLHALQTIPPSGDPKLFGKGSATAGHYFTIGNLATTPAICLAEGYATAARIHEMTGCACIVTFYAHNLVSVTDTIASYRQQIKGYESKWKNVQPDFRRPLLDALSSIETAVKDL